MEVGSGGQLLSSGWPHYPETSIQPAQMLLGTPELLPEQPRPLCILSKEVRSCSNRHVPLWHMLNDVTYCQQLPTVQAGGGGAAVTAHCHRMAEDIQLVNALNNNNDLTANTRCLLSLKFNENKRLKMFYQTQTARRPPKGTKMRSFCPWWPWPLTLTFKLVQVRDQTRLPWEFGAYPFSGSRDISCTNKKSQTDGAKNRTSQSSLHAVINARTNEHLTKHCMFRHWIKVSSNLANSWIRNKNGMTQVCLATNRASSTRYNEQRRLRYRRWLNNHSTYTRCAELHLYKNENQTGRTAMNSTYYADNTHTKARIQRHSQKSVLGV